MPKLEESHVFKTFPVRISASFLVIVNLIPLLGVLFLGWSVAGIIRLYWSENVVVGFYNVLKMKKAEGQYSKSSPKRSTSKSGNQGPTTFFFTIHYGFFTLIHGVFVFSFFKAGRESLNGAMLTVILLFVSHGISYRKNFIANHEYQRVTKNALFLQPYKRIVIMHLTILIGGSAAQSMGSPPAALAVMVILKTLIDLVSHLVEHKKFSQEG